VQQALEEPLGYAVEPAPLLFVGRAQEPAAQHGREGDGDHAGDQDGDADGDGEFLEQAAEHAAMKSTGMKTAASDSVMDTMVKPISPEPRSEACKAAAQLDVPDDVLEHDDGVVTTNPMERDEGHHGKIVQAEAEAGT